MRRSFYSIRSVTLILFYVAFAVTTSPGITLYPALVASYQSAAQRDEVEKLLQEAAALLQSRKPSEAEPLLRRALLLAPQNADAHNLLGIVLDQGNKVAESESEYRAALRFNPNLISARA